jgi:hypothetical protein
VKPEASEMTFYRRPRVFLSYRHQERRPGLGGDGYNRKHREWVGAFAKALGGWNVDVIWDERLRTLFKPHTKADPEKLEFLAEVSTLCLQSAQAFVPVLTKGYLERIMGGETGTVSEEWARALDERDAGRLEIIPVVREWPIPDMPVPPLQVDRKRAWDFRFVAPDKDEVELLADSFHLAWNIHRPPIDMSFSSLISAYLKFCVHQFRLPWPGMETWGCNFERPRVFIDVMRKLSTGALGGAVKPQRGTVEFELFGELEDEQFNDEAQGTHSMMQQAFSTVAAERVGFDFATKAGAKPKGLYFGPTLKEFSYR